MNKKAVLIIIIFLLSSLLFCISVSPAQAQQPYVLNSLTVVVYPDGIVYMEHTLTVDPAYPSINVTLFGQTFENLTVADKEKIPLNYSLTDSTLRVDTLGAREVKISYETADLTNKVGRYWTLVLGSPITVTIILPVEATIISLNQVPEALESREGRTVLIMPQGNIEITYIIGIVGTREHAAILIREAENAILEAKKLGVIVTEAEAKLQQARDAFNAGKYSQAEEFARQTKDLTNQTIETANQALTTMNEAEKVISEIEIQNIIVTEARLKLQEAEKSFSVGNYSEARKLASQAKDLAIEIKGNAIQALDVIKRAEKALAEAQSEGRTVGLNEANRFLSQAKDAYAAGDYQRALNLANQANVAAQTAATPIPPFSLWIMGVIIVVIITGFLAYKLAKKLKEPSAREKRIINLEKIFRSHPQLRPDDKEAIVFIAEAGGEVFESELRDKFSLPRTTIWRMVKRLKNEGIIEIRKIGGQNLVKIKPKYEIKNPGT